MSSQSHGRLLDRFPVIAAVVLVWSAMAAAQDRPTPKWELFGGYSFFYPNADVHGTLPLGLLPVSSRLESNPRGAGASITYNFDRWFGLTLDTSTHWGAGETTLGKKIDDASFSNLSIGPKITFRGTHLSPFLEALVGDQRLAPALFDDIDKLGFILGGGLDINVSRHVALRLIRADYVMSSYRYGPSATTPSTDIRGLRAEAGLVFMWGGGEREVVPASAACSVHPPQIFAGDSVTVTAEGSNFNPKRTLVYAWSGSGVTPDATGASTQIDTSNLQPGLHQVTANLNDGSKHGVASCGASFTVKQPNPPVIACSADPASVKMGATSTISSDASSPDGRRLAYSYTSSAGTINGNAASATLDSGGAGPGTITVTCTVSDDRNPPLTASSAATLAVQPPPPPPDVSAIEHRLALHSVYFATAKPTEEKPDAGLLPSQETTLSALAADFLILLQSKTDASLTLEGHADPRGSLEYNQTLSERRVDRTRRYLIGQGVPEASIQTAAFGMQKNLTNAQVKKAVEGNPELGPEDRQRVLKNMRTIILASNRRVDITLNNSGHAAQESVRQYPFNAADSLSLIKEEQTNKAVKPIHKK